MFCSLTENNPMTAPIVPVPHHSAPFRRHFRRAFGLLILLGFIASPALSAQTGTLTIQAATPGTAIPPSLFGAFFEEINLAGDGGLYGELIRNRSCAGATSPDFWSTVAQGTSGWLGNSGTWAVDASVSPKALNQSSNGQDFRATYALPGSAAWANYTLTLQARKLGGSEGFLIMFNMADSNNWLWWNLGGWTNTTHAVEQCVNGVKTSGSKVSGSVTSNQWYDIRIVTQGATVSCYLDNVLTQTFTAGAVLAGGIGLSTWNTQAEFRNIVVTGQDSRILYQSDFNAAESIAGQISLDASKPLNASHPASLKLAVNATGGSVGAANSGYWGIALQAGAAYDLKLHACSDGGLRGPLTARLESADGGTVYAQTSFSGLSVQWQAFGATLVPTASAPHARLVISIAQAGTVWLNVVSLFPQASFKNHSNGMRPDLATAVAAMKPAFLRFPGGCYVEGNLLANAFRWKKSIGDVSERPGHWNLWGYTSTDGLGFHEYLQYCEDIAAAPLFCINAGISHGDVVPLTQMGEFVQDALDAIEYANGDVTTPWGAKRAANGHPAPFNLKTLEIGNENGGTNYNDRYALFYDAIKAAYPDIKLVACVWGGTPTSRPFDLMDEHYYTDPATMASYASKYDNYNRSGAKVFVGEYAVTSGYGTYGNLTAALGEAAFMTGIERNCDVVAMASYAPLFANLNMTTWKPDAIYYDNSKWFGTPAYYVQKLFANNMGSVLLPLVQDFSANYGGSIGLSTWNTQAEFRNIAVTGADSQLLYQSNLDAAGAADWTPTSGTWSINTGVSPAAYRQTANGNDYRSTYTAAGSTAWKDYTLTLQARKRSGSEGFLIMFHVADTNNYVWWNLGGWTNTSHAVEYCINGSKISGPKVAGSITTNQWYDIKITIQGRTANCYLNNVLTQTFTLPSTAPVYSVASMKESTREIILKSVNPSAAAVTANIDLNGVGAIAPNSQQTILTSSSPAEENSLAEPIHVVPVTYSTSTPSTRFALNLPAYSATILRMQSLAVAPANLAVSPGNQQAVLSWSSAAGAASYTLLRATSASGPFAAVATGLTDPGFVDTGLSNSTPYYYLVAAVNSAGESTTASAVTTVPAAPPIASYERIGPAVLLGPATVLLTVKSSVPGRLYMLQRSNELPGAAWEDIGTPQAGTGTDLRFIDGYNSSLPRRFYRVRLTSQ